MSEILTNVRDGALYVTLNRPSDGNGVSNEMAAELTHLLLNAEERAHVVVLSGAGADFCTGRWAPGPGGGVPPEALSRRRSTEVIFNCYQAFRDCNLPVVGVVQGRAFGFGCSLAALCDVTIAADDATFQIPEMNHNIIPTMVMSALVDRVSPKHLEYLVWTREIISAERAFEMGIVSRLVPATQLASAADGLLALFAATPKAALLGGKEYARTAYDMPIRGAVDFARNLHATVNSSTSAMQKPVV